MTELPSGTVTLLVTDIENSTGHWEDAPAEMREALEAHDRIVGDTIVAHDGLVVQHSGDGYWGVFTSAPRAAAAAVAIQREIQSQPDEIRRRLKIRVGMHTGNASPAGMRYYGSTANRVARVADLANGDQIVCSAATAALLADVELRSEGLHELRNIGVDEIYLLTHDDVVTDPRPLRRPVLKPNLPAVHSSLIGREHDVERVMGWLDAGQSLVTLAGPGGVGKTRLAIELGERWSSVTSSPAVFAGLASVRDGSDVLAAIADVLGARQQPGMDLLESIVDFVLDRTLLLIVDNCEHLLDAARSVVRRLIDVPGVTIVATSRAALDVDGERLVRVEPLDLANHAVELFVDRAQRYDSTFELGPGDDTHISDVVTRLEGLPLAIELAAARVRVLSPKELSAELARSLDVLGADEDPSKRTTLRSTVAWSHQLLDPVEAAVFERMSVFAGGATMDAIRTVCADGDLVEPAAVDAAVLGLVDQSMVIGWTDRGRRRFRTLETMRQFGERRLRDAGVLSDVQARHAQYYLDLAATENDRLFSDAEREAWQSVDAEWDNLRVAFDTLRRTGEIDRAASLVSSLVYHATFAMRLELFSWADELRTMPGAAERVSYGDLCGAAALGAYFTVSGKTDALAAEGLAADPPDPQGWCRVALAAVSLNNTLSPERSDEMTRSWLESGPTTVGARLWANAVRAFHLCSHEFDPVAAKPHADEVLRIARETGSVSAQALAGWAHGMVMSFGNLEGAISVWNDAREGPRSMPDDHLLDHLLVGLVLHFTVEHHGIVEALRNCHSALRSAVDSHYYAGASHLFGVTAIALCRGGEPKTGAKLVGAMEANGHFPRANARQALVEALGERAERYKLQGTMLTTTQAARVALDALSSAIERLGDDPVLGQFDTGQPTPVAE